VFYLENLQKVIDIFKLNVIAIEDVPESFSSSVYKLALSDGRKVYIKIPYSKIKLKREYAALDRMKDELPVPDVLDYWEGDDEVTGAMMLSAIDGEPITGKVDASLTKDIGSIHASLHSLTPNEHDYKSVISNEYLDWATFIRTTFYSFAEDTKKLIDPALFEESLLYFENLSGQLPTPDGPCFIHMDFRPGNLLVRDNQMVGLIDFESVRIGATEIDFTKINRDLFLKNPGTLEAYARGYESIRPLIDLNEILPFYRFTDAFNSIGWCQRRGVEKNRAFYLENLGYLKMFLRSKE